MKKMNNSFLMGELVASTSASTIIATSVDASPLLTALITFGVSLVSIVGGELIKFLVAYLKKKTENLKEDEEKEDRKEEK